jgi:hypothetical protein
VKVAKRKAISKTVRFEVFKRDKFRCVYCGAGAPDTLLVLDHVVPVAGGGKNDILNLVTACDGCNAGKGARALSDSSVASRRRGQAEKEAELREQALEMIAWQRGLLSRKEEVARQCFGPLLEHTGVVLTAKGLVDAIRLVDACGPAHVLETAASAVEFLRLDEVGEARQESLLEAFRAVEKRARWATACDKEPNLREAARIRASITRRVNFWHQSQKAQLLQRIKALLDTGATREDLCPDLYEASDPHGVEAALNHLESTWS